MNHFLFSLVNLTSWAPCQPLPWHTNYIRLALFLSPFFPPLFLDHLLFSISLSNQFFTHSFIHSYFLFSIFMQQLSREYVSDTLIQKLSGAPSLHAHHTHSCPLFWMLFINPFPFITLYSNHLFCFCF